MIMDSKKLHGRLIMSGAFEAYSPGQSSHNYVGQTRILSGAKNGGHCVLVPHPILLAASASFLEVSNFFCSFICRNALLTGPSQPALQKLQNDFDVCTLQYADYLNLNEY
jgi:hypothetical protein